MKLESIEVGNFRNYENAKLEFHPKTNILYGDNAQGKTNILESMFVQRPILTKEAKIRN